VERPAVRPGLSSWRNAVRARVQPPRRRRLPRQPLNQAPYSHGRSRQRRLLRRPAKASCDCVRANGKTPRLPERAPARRGHSSCRNAARARHPPLRPREVSFPPRFRPRRPLLSRDLCSRGGNSRRHPPRPHRAGGRPRPCRRVNTQRSSRRALAARRTPWSGSTRRRASTTIREPASTATPSRAHTCARLKRAQAAIVRRGTANVRPRLIKRRGASALIFGSSRRSTSIEPSQLEF
jgi:hypothetical protein